MIRLALITALLAAWYFWYRWRKAADNESRRRLVNQFLIWGLIGGICLLAAAGRIHWLGAVFAALFPLLKLLFGWLFSLFPLLAKIYRNKAPASGAGGSNDKSSITTRFLEMWLDHETGSLGGRVLEGAHQGSELDQLDEQQLRDLYASYLQQDADSARLLESYLQRRFDQFQSSHGEREQQETGSNPPHASDMDAQEARQILGVDEQSDPAAIRKAHRKLMQKLHPDHGGNDYFAAKLNQARDTLLKAYQDR